MYLCGACMCRCRVEGIEGIFSSGSSACHRKCCRKSVHVEKKKLKKVAKQKKKSWKKPIKQRTNTKRPVERPFESSPVGCKG